MEGAIDAMFLKNGVAISGVYLTDLQADLLYEQYPFLQKVWIFDNPKVDETGKEKMIEMAMNSQDLFFTWGDKFAKYKDLNDYCVKEGIWDINPEDIINLSIKGANSILYI
jgi:hypothetical protein